MGLETLPVSVETLMINRPPPAYFGAPRPVSGAGGPIKRGKEIGRDEYADVRRRFQAR
jgi:hypothetical protein